VRFEGQYKAFYEELLDEIPEKSALASRRSVFLGSNGWHYHRYETAPPTSIFR
jgi:hypothetical protein